MKMDLCLYLTLSILTINKVFHHGSGLSLPSTTVTQHGSEVERYYNNTHLELQVQQRQPEENEQSHPPGCSECYHTNCLNCCPLITSKMKLISQLECNSDMGNQKLEDQPTQSQQIIQNKLKIHVVTSKSERKLPDMDQTANTDGPQKVAETTSRAGKSQH